MESTRRAKYTGDLKTRQRKKRKKWDDAHPENRKANCRKQDTLACQNLTDRYVKKSLIKRTHLAISDLTPELIELQRAVLLLKRILKERGEK